MTPPELAEIQNENVSENKNQYDHNDVAPPELSEIQNENEKQNENEYSFISLCPHHFIPSSPPQNGDQQAIPFKPKTENEIERVDAPRAVVSFGRCPRIATQR